MNKEEKKVLFRRLLKARPRGEGATRLAKWCRVTAGDIYHWRKAGGSWPPPDREARMWEYFDYVLDEGGTPIKKESVPSPSRREILTETDDLSSEDAINRVVDFLTKHLQKRKIQGDQVGEMKQEYAQITTPGERRIPQDKRAHRRD